MTKETLTTTQFLHAKVLDANLYVCFAIGGQEWDRLQPGQRLDIFPQFSPMKTALPQPLPADPPEEDEEEDDKKEEEGEEPEKEPEQEE